MLGTLGGFEKFDQYVDDSVVGETAFPSIPLSAQVQKPERIFVQAHPDNTEDIYIGKTGLAVDGSTGGFILSPGADSVLPFNIHSSLFHISLGTQKIFITYLAGGNN